MVPARGAKLLQLQPVLILLLVLCRSVVAIFAVTALQGNNLAHKPSLNSGFQYWRAANWHIDGDNAIPSDQQ
jgi:hypothetical protein